MMLTTKKFLFKRQKSTFETFHSNSARKSTKNFQPKKFPVDSKIHIDVMSIPCIEGENNSLGDVPWLFQAIRFFNSKDEKKRTFKFEVCLELFFVVLLRTNLSYMQKRMWPAFNTEWIEHQSFLKAQRIKTFLKHFFEVNIHIGIKDLWFSFFSLDVINWCHLGESF